MSVVEVGGRTVALTNLEKILWPESGFTKGQMLQYYVDVAPVLLPHLAGRPLTLRRFPDGIHGLSWHQNECKGEPEWLTIHERRGREGRLLRFCVVDDLASLLWVANQAAVELHPFTWRIDAPEEPTQIVFDLDPGAPAGLLEAARVALLLRPLLEELGFEPHAKVTGSLGVHVQAPLAEPLDAKALAREIAGALAVQNPQLVAPKVHRSERAGRVYVDWLQNDPARQNVAPYSLRGVPGPLVATPVRWSEVEDAVAREDPDSLRFGPDDVRRRIARDDDLFAPLR